MTGEEARATTVAAELALAEECLKEARYAFEGEFFRLVRTRCNYAVFHAATAVFANVDQSFRKHSALLGAIDVQLVRPGKVPPEFTGLVRELYQSRLKGDYGDASPVSEAEAARAITAAEKAVRTLQSVVSAEPQDPAPPQ